MEVRVSLKTNRLTLMRMKGLFTRLMTDKGKDNNLCNNFGVCATKLNLSNKEG